MIRILLADDEARIRQGLRRQLTQLLAGVEEVEFLEAEDGGQALVQAREGRPDLLFLDIHMPVLRGLDLVEQLGALGRNWLILVVTGHDEFEYARRALSLGVFEFLLKPVSEDEFRSVLGRARAELARRRDADEFARWSRTRVAAQGEVLAETLARDWVEGRTDTPEARRSAGYLNLEVPAQPVLGRSPGAADRPALRAVLGPGAWVWGAEDGGTGFLAPSVPPEGAGALSGRWEVLVCRTAEEVPATWARLGGLLASPSEEGGLVDLARSYLEEHYSDPDLSLDAAAAFLQLSPGYLSRLLKAATGRSFVAYVTWLRMAKAQVLLEDPRLRIAEAALRVGYRDQNYFCRHFKAETGRTPKEWQTGPRRTVP